MQDVNDKANCMRWEGEDISHIVYKNFQDTLLSFSNNLKLLKTCINLKNKRRLTNKINIYI